MDFFIHPERFWHLIWILPCVIALGTFAAIRRRRALQKLLGASHFATANRIPVGVNLSPGKRFFRFMLMLTTALLLTAAWARPTWGEKIHPFTGAGRDVIIALDLSKSMLCQDVRPSRLAHAKRFADELAERLPGDRFGLVSFAGNAFLSCPLTFDRVSFRAILDDQQIGSVPVGGTNLETALKTASSAFETAENLGHCAIVLISDGGELSGSLAREAEKLRVAKIPVVVVGIGDPAVSAPIPVPTGNGRTEYLKDRDGNTVNTRLEERGLAELAAKTGGIYIRSTTTEMGDALAAGWLKKLTPGAQNENVHAVPIERREWFLIPALLTFLLYLLLGESTSQTKGMRAAAFGILLRAPKTFALLTLAGILAGAPQADAQDASETEVETAEASDAQESPEALYNRGVQAQEDGDIKHSRELYQSALARPQVSEALRASTTQNLGAGFHEQGREGSGTAAVSAQSNLDEALKNVDSAEENFKRAQTFYRDFLRGNTDAETAGTTRNLQILLNDLKQLEALKKQIEELKKQMQEAAQQAQDAAQKQEQSNDRQQSEQQKEQQQQEAQKAAQQAQQQTEQMKSAAEKLNNESLKNAAEQASQELQQAQEEQQRGNGEKAEEHLEKAAEILKQSAEQNSGKDEQKNQKGSQGNSENRESKDNQDGENGEEEQSDDGDQENDSQGNQDDLSQESPEEQSAQGGNAEEERELDRNATESVLRDMAKDEAERRKAIQAGKNANIRKVEKDW